MKLKAALPLLFLLLGTAVPVAAAPPTAPGDPDIEAISLLGKELRRSSPPKEVAAVQTAAIAELQAHLRRHLADADTLIWLGRRTAYLGRYREAIEIFTDGAARRPEDARFLRHRGHRYLSLRRIDDAIADFERGLALVAGRPDQVEADGLPNLFNRPTSTLKTNLWYHLGLAYYLKADFEAFRRGLPGLRGARRQRRHSGRRGLLAAARLAPRRPRGRGQPLAGGAAARSAGDRKRRLLAPLAALPRRARARQDRPAGGAGGVPGATFGYGIGVWHLLGGRTDAARRSFEQVVAGDTWAAFGYLAAEAGAGARRALKLGDGFASAGDLMQCAARQLGLRLACDILEPVFSNRSAPRTRLMNGGVTPTRTRVVEAIRLFQQGQGRDAAFRRIFETHFRPIERFFARKGLASEDCRDLTKGRFSGFIELWMATRKISVSRAGSIRSPRPPSSSGGGRRRPKKRSAIEVSRDALEDPEATLGVPEAQLEEPAGGRAAAGPGGRGGRFAGADARLPDAAPLPPAGLQGDRGDRELSVETVKAHLFRARKKLEEELADFSLGDVEI